MAPQEPRKRKRSKKTHKLFSAWGKQKKSSISHLGCTQWPVCCDSREWSVSSVSYSSRCDCNTSAHQFRLLAAPLAPCDCYYTKSNDPAERIAIYRGICGLGLSRSSKILAFFRFSKHSFGFHSFQSIHWVKRLGQLLFCGLPWQNDDWMVNRWHQFTTKTM